MLTIEHDDREALLELLALAGAVIDRWCTRIRRNSAQLITAEDGDQGEATALRDGIPRLLAHLDAASALIRGLAEEKVDCDRPTEPREEGTTSL